MKAAAAAFAADLQQQLRAEAAGDFSHVRSGGEGFGVPPPFAPSSTSLSSFAPSAVPTTATHSFGGGSNPYSNNINSSGGSAPYVAGPLARQLLKQQQQEHEQQQPLLSSPAAALLGSSGVGGATVKNNARPLPVAALIANRQREEALAASRRRQLRALPFELRVLEACLDSSATQFAILTEAIERAAAPCLRTPTAAKLTTDFLKRMRALKQRIVVTRIKLETIKEVLDKLLDDDSDMANLDLTLRAETEESKIAEAVAAAAAAAAGGDENCSGANDNDAAAAAVAAVAAHLDRKSISVTSPAAALASYAAAAATTGGGGGGSSSVQGPPSSSGGVGPFSPFDVSCPAPPKAASISGSVRSGREGKKRFGRGGGRALAILARRALLRRRRSAGGGSGRAGSSVDEFGDDPSFGDNGNNDGGGGNSPAPSDAGADSDDEESLPDPEEAVEMMLEAYSARMAGSLSRLDAVAELLEGVEALLDLELDVFRNSNLVLRIVFSALGLVALAVYAFTGYWAMNMRERTEMGVAEDEFTDDEKKALLEGRGWVLTGAGDAQKLFPPGSHKAFIAWSVGISAVSVAALLVFGAWARWGAGLGLTTRAKGGKRGARRRRKGRWPFGGARGGGNGNGGAAWALPGALRPRPRLCRRRCRLLLLRSPGRAAATACSAGAARWPRSPRARAAETVSETETAESE